MVTYARRIATAVNVNSRNALEYSSQVHKYLNLQCSVPNPAPSLSSSPCTIISPPSSGCRLHSSCLIMSCYCFFADHALPNSVLLVSLMQNDLLQLIIDEHSYLGGSALRILKLWGQVSPLPPWFCHLVTWHIGLDFHLTEGTGAKKKLTTWHQNMAKSIITSPMVAPPNRRNLELVIRHNGI